ncbi:MAG TPA: alpha/beta hydrolase [Polyangiaceae bacterium]
MNTSETSGARRDASSSSRTPSGRVVSKDGSIIAYDRLGNGPPLVLIVGALCSRALGPGVKLAPLLAERFTVYSYDRRGRGESTEGGPYTALREIEDLQALIAEAGGSVFAFGHSSGAVLALEAAAHGLPIRKLALYEAPLIVDGSRAGTNGDWEKIDALIAQGQRGDALKIFLKMVGVPAFAVTLMSWLPVWRKLIAVAHTLPHDGALVRELQRGQPLRAPAWATVTAPALALVGGKSPVWMHNGNQAIVRALANAESRTLEGQTHDVAAKALAPVLTRFFAGP